MEKIFKGKIQNLILPFEHNFKNENVWVKVINRGKIQFSNHSDFKQIIEQFEIVDNDINEGITKAEIKYSQFEKVQYPSIEITKNGDNYKIELYTSGYPDNPLVIIND